MQESKNLVILTSLLSALANLNNYSSFLMVEKVGSIKLKKDRFSSSSSDSSFKSLDYEL